LTGSTAAKKATREIGCSFRLTSNQLSDMYTPSVYAQPEQVKEHNQTRKYIWSALASKNTRRT
jgi:hypothetical protein